jgi:hypothetical protein
MSGGGIGIGSGGSGGGSGSGGSGSSTLPSAGSSGGSGGAGSRRPAHFKGILKELMGGFGEYAKPVDPQERQQLLGLLAGRDDEEEKTVGRYMDG